MRPTTTPALRLLCFALVYCGMHRLVEHRCICEASTLMSKFRRDSFFTPDSPCPQEFNRRSGGKNHKNILRVYEALRKRCWESACLVGCRPRPPDDERDHHEQEQHQEQADDCKTRTPHCASNSCPGSGGLVSFGTMPEPCFEVLKN